MQYLTYFKSFLTCNFYVNVKCKFINNKDDIFLVKTEIPEFKLKPELRSEKVSSDLVKYVLLRNIQFWYFAQTKVSSMIKIIYKLYKDLYIMEIYLKERVNILMVANDLLQ